MHAAFAGQLAEGVFANDGEGGGLDAGLFAVLIVVDLGFEALLLGPAQVHAHEHLGPVLALGAARAGMHGDDGVERIGLAGEHGAGFEFLVECGQGFDVAGKIVKQIGGHDFAFAGQLEVGFNVAGAADQLFVVGDKIFEALAVAHEWLAGCRIVPEGGIGQFFFYVGEFPADAGGVKDTPAGREPGRGRERKRIRDRSMTCFALMT